MKAFIAALAIIIMSGKQLYAQQKESKGEILSAAASKKIFTDSISKQFNLQYPIQRAYSYHDQTGAYYLVLCESRDEIVKDDTLHYKIKAVNLKQNDNGLTKTWELNDFRNSADPESGQENSIWFWTKFSSVTDLDGDGIIEPLIVYGSSGLNGYDDGRVKFILYYKGQKIAIRHQNSVLDEGRNMQVDASFYTLPPAIQKHIRMLLHTLAEKNFTILPYNYEKAMDKRSLQIN